MRAYDILGIGLDDMANTVKLKRDLCLQIAYKLMGKIQTYILKDNTQKNNMISQTDKGKKKTLKKCASNLG